MRRARLASCAFSYTTTSEHKFVQSPEVYLGIWIFWAQFSSVRLGNRLDSTKKNILIEMLLWTPIKAVLITPMTFFCSKFRKKFRFLRLFPAQFSSVSVEISFENTIYKRIVDSKIFEKPSSFSNENSLNTSLWTNGIQPWQHQPKSLRLK